MWVHSSNPGYASSLKKGGGEIPQAAKMNAVLCYLLQVLDSLVL